MATVKKAAAKAVVPVARPVAPKPRIIPVEEPETEAALAGAYLTDRVYAALLERGEPAKISEITLEIDNPRITFPLVRRALSGSARFILTDRLWNLKARYLDTARPTERLLVDVVKAAGRPLDTATMANELSMIFSRDASNYFQLVQKVVQNDGVYFKAGGGAYGLAEWLPLADGETLSDVLFDNQIAPATLTRYEAAAEGIDWSDLAGATYAIASKLGVKSLPNKVAGALAWRALGSAFDAQAHMLACLADSRLVWLSGRGGRWISRELADRLERFLEARAATLAGEEEQEPAPRPTPAPVPEPVEAAAPEPVEAPTPEPTPVPEPTVQPIAIDEEALEAMARIVSERGRATEALDLLALQYEVVPGDPSFVADLEALTARLKADGRFHYVGAGRFREAGSIPLFVNAIPEMLAFPDLQFVSMDGEIMDEEIEDEGFVGTLRQDVLSPLVQDVGDDDGPEGNSGGELLDSVRLVLKAHHKEIGTFPLCQVPTGFLPADAPMVEIVVHDSDGGVHEIYVNHEVRLAFGFFGLYEKLAEDSGAVFHLRRTTRPYEFRFEVEEEPDPQVYLTPQRLADLIALREHAEETGDMATFDLACEIVEDYPKGLDFAQLMTELNVVRRVTRRKLASILSNYYCFMQKAGTNLWRYDARKRDMGTDRTKRKYIKR